MTIHFVNHTRLRLPRKYLKGWLQYVARRLNQKGVGKDWTHQELTIALLPRAQARALNKKFRGRDYATDVLSFLSLDPQSLGELVFCGEILKRQAKEHGLNFRQEFAYLALHGLLHLLGFEHEGSKKAAQKMYKLQDEIFSDIDRF